MNTKDFGKRLIYHRKHHGLSQAEVAEKCKLTIRTIQRIENRQVTPRASTIKIISENLKMDYLNSTKKHPDFNSIKHNLKHSTHLLFWLIKNLFNLKTNPMKKISFLIGVMIIIVFLFSKSQILIANGIKSVQNTHSIQIKKNKDNSIQYFQVEFTNNLTLDSLMLIKKEVAKHGFKINYKILEFDQNNKLKIFACEVKFENKILGHLTNKYSDRKKIGIYRDYSQCSKYPYGIGCLNDKRKAIN